MGTGEGGARCSGERHRKKEDSHISGASEGRHAQISQKACGFGEMGPEMALKQGKAHSWRGDEEVQKLRPRPNRSGEQPVRRQPQIFWVFQEKLISRCDGHSSRAQALIDQEIGSLYFCSIAIVKPRKTPKVKFAA